MGRAGGRARGEKKSLEQRERQGRHEKRTYAVAFLISTSLARSSSSSKMAEAK